MLRCIVPVYSTYFAELPSGERCKIALKLVLACVGENSILFDGGLFKAVRVPRKIFGPDFRTIEYAMVEIPSSLFHEPQRVTRTLTALHESYISSGATSSVEEFTTALARVLPLAPDPDLAITNLLRFSEATLSTSSLFNDLVKHAVLMEVLVKMLSSSQYFADILVRDPEVFRWLTASDSLTRPRKREDVQAEVERAMKLFQKPERKLDALKRLYRREILRIGARDILGEADLATATEELSHLADALVEAACRVAQQQLAERFPVPPQTPYAVIGLGKLGGCELNYSSDIDIIFVYGDEGELCDANGRTRTYHEYFNAFVEKMVVNLSQSSGEGHLYRVDLRLRPESGAGPLARSLTSYLLYYESRGELWERQMLLKARPVAGDREFGERFIRELEPFVYPRTFFQNPKDYIARIKARIEAAIVGEENVKLRAGGIRDIEFIVQALQLIHAGKNKAIRSRNTLQAIRLLCEARLLDEQQSQTLTEAYIFFRTVEHRLQMMLNTQTAEMPKDGRSLAVLARKVGLRSAAEFNEKNRRLLLRVREIFDDVLATDSSMQATTLSTVLDGNADHETTARVLGNLGFSDTRKAAKNLATVISGTSLLEARDLDNRAREAFRDIAEPLFAEISRSPIPDATLHNFALLVSAQKLPELFSMQLKEPNFRKLILTVCAVSPRFAKGLSRNPLLLETLSTDPQFLSGPSLVSPLPTTSLIALKNQEELRAGIRFVLGITTFDQFTAELSQLADVIVASAVQEECAKARTKKPPLALFALGKYGTRESTLDSDMDLLYVGNAKSISGQENLEKLARGILQRLTVINEEGKLYDVDARLRPEGKSAPLIVDRKAYTTYLATRASLWERQSLTRLRFVAGDERLGKEIADEVDAFVYTAPLPADWIANIVAMRRKTEGRSRVSGNALLDFKLGAGGMVDIEFLAQMIQLKFGRTETRFRHARPTDVVMMAEQEGLGAQAAELVAAYQFFRRIETMMRITLEERGTILPEGEKLERLAAVMDRLKGDDLRHRVAATMRQTRKTFLDLTEQLSMQ